MKISIKVFLSLPADKPFYRQDIDINSSLDFPFSKVLDVMRLLYPTSKLITFDVISYGQ